MVDLKIEQGEVSSIIGPNGAGKTTLFNLLSGALRCDEGKIIFKGEDITNLESHALCSKGIGRSFQITNIFPKFTVFENIQLAVLTKHRRNRDFFSQAENLNREDTLRIISEVGLADYASSLASSLSHGDQKQLDIALALASKPELLLLDEPTAGLNSQESRKIMDSVYEIGKSRGMTVLFIEHDMSIVFSISEKIRVMHQGSLIIEGKPDEIMNHDEVKRIYLGE
jgi:branched-chain amino acid transport system ATP-binding protein